MIINFFEKIDLLGSKFHFYYGVSLKKRTPLGGILTLIIGMLQFHDLGYPDWVFAVAFVFAVITVHDAMGVRYEASKHAIILNNMVVNLSEEEKADLGFGKKGRLKEMLGHRYTEVLGGILVGIIVALIGYFIVR